MQLLPVMTRRRKDCARDGWCCVEGRTLVRSTRLKDLTLCRNNACAYRQWLWLRLQRRVSQNDEKSYYLFLKDLLEKEKNDYPVNKWNDCTHCLVLDTFWSSSVATKQTRKGAAFRDSAHSGLPHVVPVYVEGDHGQGDVSTKPSGWRERET